MSRRIPWSIYIRDHYRDLLSSVSLGAIVALPLKICLGLLAAGFAASGIGAGVVIGVGIITGIGYLIYKMLQSSERRDLLFTKVPDEIGVWKSQQGQLAQDLEQKNRELNNSCEEYLQEVGTLTRDQNIEAKQSAITTYKAHLAQTVAKTEIIANNVLEPKPVDLTTWQYKVKRFLGISCPYVIEAMVVEGVTDLDARNQISDWFVGISMAISTAFTLLLSPFIYSANEIEDALFAEHREMKYAKNALSTQRTHVTNQLQVQQSRLGQLKQLQANIVDTAVRERALLETHAEDERGLLRLYEQLKPQTVSSTLPTPVSNVVSPVQFLTQAGLR